MISDRMKWSWRGKTIEVGFETRGEGPAVLMLPALSSISTRSEMRPLAEQLASAFTTIAIDWPGFGDRPRPAIAWEPDAYRKFLEHILQELPKPTATCGRSRCRVPARPRFRTSRLCRKVVSRRTYMARAVANGDGTPGDVPVRL